MKLTELSLIRLIGVLALIGIVAAGCAATPQQEEEGGISGTGNDINCELAKNKKHPSCIDK